MDRHMAVDGQCRVAEETRSRTNANTETPRVEDRPWCLPPSPHRPVREHCASLHVTAHPHMAPPTLLYMDSLTTVSRNPVGSIPQKGAAFESDPTCRDGAGVPDYATGASGCVVALRLPCRTSTAVPPSESPASPGRLCSRACLAR